MRFAGFLSVCACAAALPVAASAASITDSFTSFWALGDSLTAYVGEAGGETTLRASDGPLWSEQIILDFRDAGLTAETMLYWLDEAGTYVYSKRRPMLPLYCYFVSDT